MPYDSPFPEGSAWDRCYQHFLASAYRRSESEGTVRLYSGILRRFFAGKNPEQVTREEVEDFINRPSESTRSRGKRPANATINARISAIKMFYAYASTLEIYSGRNPADGISYGRASSVYRAFSLEELQQFFAAIPTTTVQGLRNRAVFLLYFWTGRRRAEIVRLRWSDLKQGMVTGEDGKSRAAWLYRFRGKGQGKHAYKWRELPAPAKRAIDAYLEASGRAGSIKADDPLFVGRGSSPLSSTAIAYHLKRCAKAAGLDATRFSLHSFRHTAAQQRYEADKDLLRLMDFLDHQSLDTTYRYIRRLTGEADPVAELLMDKFGQL